MTINCTLFVQGVHFIIAYVLLERLFFRYAMKSIKKEEQTMKNLKQTIENQNRSAATLRAHIDEQWQREQRMLLSKIQQISYQKKPLKTFIDIDTYNPQRYYEDTKLAEECSNALLTKLMQ